MIGIRETEFLRYVLDQATGAGETVRGRLKAAAHQVTIGCGVGKSAKEPTEMGTVDMTGLGRSNDAAKRRACWNKSINQVPAAAVGGEGSTFGGPIRDAPIGAAKQKTLEKKCGPARGVGPGVETGVNQAVESLRDGTRWEDMDVGTCPQACLLQQGNGARSRKVSKIFH